jgi:hypothetical protein
MTDVMSRDQTLDDHITFIVESMKPIAEQIGLAPSA